MEQRADGRDLTPPPPLRHPEYWHNHIHRPRSRPPSGHGERRRAKKRSPNHVRARPANPLVISSITSSFETLTPTLAIQSDDCYSGTGSLGSGSKCLRPYSSDGTVLSMPPNSARQASSAGFGMEYGSSTALAAEGDDEVPDAAPSPAIRMSRPPSGLSNYAAPSPLQTNGHTNGYLRPASTISRTSSFSSQIREKEKVAKTKLSAESWVRQTKQDAFELAKERKSQRSLRRVPSQQTLQPPRQSEDSAPPSIPTAHLSALSRAEQIIARIPPPLASPTKDRLYLGETGVSENYFPTESPTSSRKASEANGSSLGDAKTPASELTTPLRISPKKTPIIDSIPTRTSSLRQSNASPVPGKRKDRKAKGETAASIKSDSIVEHAAQSIPDSSWADLGEDDETVRRIRQLRERRRSRMEESTKSYSMGESVPTEKAEASHTPVLLKRPARRSEDTNQVAHIRPSAKRASTVPDSKARKVLGITENGPTPVLNGTVVKGVNTNHKTSDRVRRPPPPAETNGNHSGAKRPPIAASSTQRPSLDYSYAQPVDALQGIERELPQKSRPRSRQASITHVRKNSTSTRDSRCLQDLDVSAPTASDTQSTTSSNANARPRAKSKRRIGPQDRSTLHPREQHPDLPLQVEKKKSRRKSMSDARHARVPDEDVELPRRDSIEDAVLDYLHAPRLSRKMKHPFTGRTIAYSEVGDPHGAAVFICVGMGLTRYVTAFYDELATTLRLRLITIDRPGVGGSEPYPSTDKSGPLSWPEDVLSICQQLGISKFSLLAHSAGAIYALATALILPYMIKGKVHLLAPWIPPSQLEAIPHPTSTAPPAVPLPRGQRILRVLPASFLKAANSSFITATSASLKPASKRQIQAARVQQRHQEFLSPTGSLARPSTSTSTQDLPDYHRRESMMLMDRDMPTTMPTESFPIAIKEKDEEAAMPNESLSLSATATPTDPNFTFASTALNAAEHAERERKVDYTSRLTQRTWELATRDSNPATDLLVCLERHRDVGFRYTDVHRKIVITHGSEDRRVPLGNVKWLADQMNARAASEFLAGDLAGNSVPQRKETWANGSSSQGGCEVRVLQGEGHGLMASAPIMSDVLTEIAAYWVGQEKGRMTM